MLDLSTKIEELKKLLEAEQMSILTSELEELHYADVAEILEHVDEAERTEIFKLLNPEKAADTLEELNAQIQVELLSSIDEEKAAKIILKMPHDFAADILGDVSDEASEAYLSKLPLRLSNQLRELLNYGEDTAGGNMNTEFLSVDMEMTTQETLNFIRSKAERDNIDFYYVYVTDQSKRLRGVLSLRTLIKTPGNVQIKEIMVTDVIKLNVFDDQELVADTLRKYSLLAVPVVDDYGRLKGIVTWDDAQDITEEETTEDIYQSSGISTDAIDEDEILSGRLSSAVRARTPWLFVTLFGEFIAVNVANHFDHTLQLVPIIAIFMPLLAGLGGNIGTQSITIMVRGLSTGQININSAVHHIVRELKIGLIIGVLFGLIVMAVTYGWKHNFALGLIVGGAMTTNMTLATVLGTVTPFVLKRLNIDPAVASGPFIATAIDVLGLTIYFTFVTLGLHYLV